MRAAARQPAAAHVTAAAVTGHVSPPGSAFDLAGWRSACDRNRALAVADYVARVERAALAVGGTDAVLVTGRDLAALSTALGSVLALHTPRPGQRPARCRACSTRWRPVGWPCATRRAVHRALEPFDPIT